MEVVGAGGVAAAAAADVAPDDVPDRGGDQGVLDGEGVEVGRGFLGDIGQHSLLGAKTEGGWGVVVVS